MAVAEMRKVTLIGPRQNQDTVMSTLSRLGVLQPVASEAAQELAGFDNHEASTRTLQENLTKLEYIISYLGKFESSGLGLNFFPTRIAVSHQDYHSWIKDFPWRKLHRKCRTWEQKSQEYSEERSQLEGRRQNLEPWRNLDRVPQALHESRYVTMSFIRLGGEHAASFQTAVSKDTTMGLVSVGECGGRHHFVLVALRQAQVDAFLQRHHAERVNLGLSGSAREEIRRIDARLEQLDQDAAQVHTDAARAARHLTKVKAIADQFAHQIRERQAASHMCLSQYTYAVEGWICKDDAPKLRQAFSERDTAVLVRKPGARDRHGIPVALRNRGVFRPFEMVTELYGLPRYLEIDPTPLLAPFFALFLALCLTDGGYGIILAVLAFLIPRRMDVGPSGRRLFLLLFISGLVTIAVGLMTGGVFGLQISQLPPLLQPIRHLQLFNPVQQPMIFLGLALALGVVHLFLGIAVSFKEKVRRGRLLDGVLDDVSWMIVIIGALILVAPAAQGFILGTGGSTGGALAGASFSPTELGALWFSLSPWQRLGAVLFLGGLGVLFLFKGRKSKSWGIRLAKGGFELYGLLQLFGDVLSYSRLLALGLATTVIATVVNTIAAMMGGTPVVGPVLMVLVLVAGHFANLVINCLSGFIHTARLQFVEFFGKFYQGGGHAFTPLSRQGKYVKIMS